MRISANSIPMLFQFPLNPRMRDCLSKNLTGLSSKF